MLPKAPVCSPDALDQLLISRLRFSTPQQLSILPDCTEGLENRLSACAAECISRSELLEKLKTRRYAYARLNRLCTHALLGMTQDLLHASPGYVRLLGLRKNAGSFTRLFRKSSIPIVSKAADADLNSPLMKLDMTAYELWALGAGLPSGLMLRQGVAVV